jgi:drug/metabolite transporter (DMT)-like permease
MGVVSPISSLGAVVPVMFALIGGEQLSRGRWVGVVIALAGAFCASGPEISQGFPLKPVALAFGAAFGFGTALTLMGIGSDSSALMTMVMMRATTALFTIAIAIKFRSTGGFSISDAPSLILGSLYPVVTVLLAFKFLHERLHKVQYVGVFLAVSGVAILSAF